MALIWMDGFDLYANTTALGQRYSINNNPTYPAGRFGGQALSLSNAGVQWGIPITATVSMGFAWQISTMPGTSKIIMQWQNSSTTQIELRVLSTGALRVTRNGTTLGDSAAGLVIANTYAYIEIEFLRHASAGTVNVYVNGGSVISLTGQNTGSANIDTIYSNFANDSITMLFDDLYVTDTSTRIGESRIDVIRPSSDTADKDFTASTGSDNYAMVDDTTFDGDTTYNHAAVAGDYDLYGVSNLSFTPLTIFAVQATMSARKDDAITRTLRTKTKSGSTTADGATRTMTTSYNHACDIYENNPDTAAPWTASEVNAVQLGVEIVS